MAPWWMGAVWESIKQYEINSASDMLIRDLWKEGKGEEINVSLLYFTNVVLAFLKWLFLIIISSFFYILRLRRNEDWIN